MLRVRGGTGGTPVEKHPDFVAIEEAISNAPSNGVETIVSFSVSGRSIPWAAQIRIPKGKNIVLNNINTKKVGLDAGGSTRHFFVEEGASLSAINVAFKNGKGTYGGAIYSHGTIARLDNVVFEGNFAEAGGAVALYGTGSSLGNVTGCTFRGNRALISGAGIYMEESHLTSMSITTTTFVDNKCDDLDASSGGAIYFILATGNIVVVKDSHFLNNWAYDGGAVRFVKSSISRVVFSSSLFENNLGTGAGGALNLFDSTVDLIHNCTFVRNRSGLYPFFWNFG